MMDGEMMVVLIVMIAVFGGIVKSRHKAGRDWRGQLLEESPDTLRLRDEVRMLKDRVAVLERLVTDTHGSTSLDREIERLRDRDSAR